MALGLTGTTLLASTAPTQAQPDPAVGDKPRGYVVVVDIDDSAVGRHSGGDAVIQDENCTWPACGEVHNRSGHWLRLSKNASSHLSCGQIGPYGLLFNGEDSNGYPYHWPDVDCFAGYDCGIFYGLRTYAPGEYVRIYNPVWVYNLNC